MKQFIGIRVQFLVFGVKVEGVVLGERSDRVEVKLDNGKIIRLIKSQVSMFTPEKEPEEFIPMQLLACHNSDIDCPGVQYVVEGEKLSRTMFEVFMSPCPLRRDNCRCGTRGDLRTVPSATLKRIMCGVMFGDYPEKEKKDDGAGRKDEAPARGAKKG